MRGWGTIDVRADGAALSVGDDGVGAVGGVLADHLVAHDGAAVADADLAGLWFPHIFVVVQLAVECAAAECAWREEAAVSFRGVNRGFSRGSTDFEVKKKKRCRLHLHRWESGRNQSSIVFNQHASKPFNFLRRLRTIFPLAFNPCTIPAVGMS